ncbi:unnamed protein product [Caenorhabditis brenneri]
MSLSRPVTFPLLKLPWLCIKCVLHNSDEFVLIYFATISNRTRRIVKSSNYPLKEIDVSLSGSSRISIKYQLGKTKNEKYWYFIHDKNADNGKYVLQGGTQPFRISRHFDSWRGHVLQSYTDVDTLDALKMGIDFMIDVFGCTISRVFVDGNRLLEPFVLGISFVKELFIGDPWPYNMTDLKYLLETIKVTDSYVFTVKIPANFSCDPKIFNCRQLSFTRNHSADWVTLELLCQLDASQLYFSYQRFSAEDIVSYITHWFNTKSRNLEHVHIFFDNPVSLADFKIDHLNPMPFCEKRRNRYPFVEGWEDTDMSSGMDILRQDGLLATFYVDSTSVIFYVWHKRFSDPVQQ